VSRVLRAHVWVVIEALYRALSENRWKIFSFTVIEAVGEYVRVALFTVQGIHEGHKVL
jgi:hypothetical protein